MTNTDTLPEVERQELTMESITPEFLEQETTRINALKNDVDPQDLANLEEQFGKIDIAFDSYADGVENRNPVEYLKLANREQAFVEAGLKKQGIDSEEIKQRVMEIESKVGKVFGIVDQLRNQAIAEKDQELKSQMTELFNLQQKIALEGVPTEKEVVITPKGERPVTTLEGMAQDLQTVTDKLPQDKVAELAKEDKELAELRPYEFWVGKSKIEQATELSKLAKAYELLAAQTKGQPGADKIAEQAEDYARRYERLKTELRNDVTDYENRGIREKVGRESTRRAYSQSAKGL